MFTNIEVYPYSLTFNRYGRPLYRQCQMVNFHKPAYGTYGVKTTRCGATAMVIVKRTSTMTGNTYREAMCDEHAAPWVAATKEPSNA